LETIKISTFYALYDLSILEEYEGGHRTDIKGIDELGAFINIYLEEGNGSKGFRELFIGRSNTLTRNTPRTKEINDNSASLGDFT
jgi:hypothetical protein